MPIDRVALMAEERLTFRVLDAKHGKKHSFRAVLDANETAAFEVVVVPRFATAKVALSPCSERAAQALLAELNRFLEQPSRKYSGSPGTARLGAAFWSDANDPLLMTKLFLHRRQDAAELYFDFDPTTSEGWFRRKHFGDEVLADLLASAFGMKPATPSRKPRAPSRSKSVP